MQSTQISSKQKNRHLTPPKINFGKPINRSQQNLLKIIACAVIALLILSNLFYAPPVFDDETETALSKYGSRGEEVKTIQTKLKRWGYFNGKVDGIFGAQTQEAVKYFQRKNGLTVDGIAGPATLKAMGIFSSSSTSSSTAELNMLARLISAEARGEPYTGQVAVGAVVLNRMEHPSFPNTMSGVIFQKWAFSCVDDGQWDQPVAESAYRAAKDALNGWDPSGGAIYYFNPKTATSKWIWSRPPILTIGNHRFCR